jgi:hypothetical protein
MARTSGATVPPGSSRKSSTNFVPRRRQHNFAPASSDRTVSSTSEPLVAGLGALDKRQAGVHSNFGDPRCPATVPPQYRSGNHRAAKKVVRMPGRRRAIRPKLLVLVGPAISGFPANITQSSEKRAPRGAKRCRLNLIIHGCSALVSLARARTSDDIRPRGLTEVLLRFGGTGDDFGGGVQRARTEGDETELPISKLSCGRQINVQEIWSRRAAEQRDELAPTHAEHGGSLPGAARAQRAMTGRRRFAHRRLEIITPQR